MWISKEVVEMLRADNAELKAKVEKLESLLLEKVTPPPPAPTSQTSSPSSEEVQRIAKILREGVKGTKWQKYKAKAEAALRTGPSEVTVHTGATST